MKAQIGTGFLPYEIDDVVTLKDRSGHYTITDILFIQSVKTGSAKFSVELDDKIIIDAEKIDKALA